MHQVTQYHLSILGLMSLFVLVIAASESAIALALFVLMYRQYGSLDAKVLTNIEG